MDKLKKMPVLWRRSKVKKLGATGKFYVVCCNGSCSTLPTTWDFWTEEEAIDAWNTRYTDDTGE